MELNDIRAGVQDHDKGRWFDLSDPVTGEPTGLRVKIAGPDSDTQRRAELAMSDRLAEAARNAKMHGDDQVAKIAASMAKFGWTVPCMVADDGELIAGHGRVLAATMLGLTEVPVIRLGHLDEAERRAYRIADNKLTELGEWDEAMLRDEIAGLLTEDFDLSLLGISDDDLDALLKDPEALDEDGPVEGEDDVPAVPVTPVSVPGDIWQLSSTFAARPSALVAPPSGWTNWSAPMPFTARCWTPPRAAPAAAMIFLTACARGSSDTVPSACPPVVDYTRAEQAQVAEEVARLSEGALIVEWLADYAVLRDQARACR